MQEQSNQAINLTAALPFELLVHIASFLHPNSEYGNYANLNIFALVCQRFNSAAKAYSNKFKNRLLEGKCQEKYDASLFCEFEWDLHTKLITQNKTIYTGSEPLLQAIYANNYEKVKDIIFQEDFEPLEYFSIYLITDNETELRDLRYSRIEYKLTAIHFAMYYARYRIFLLLMSKLNYAFKKEINLLVSYYDPVDNVIGCEVVAKQLQHAAFWLEAGPEIISFLSILIGDMSHYGAFEPTGLYLNNYIKQRNLDSKADAVMVKIFNQSCQTRKTLFFSKIVKNELSHNIKKLSLSELIPNRLAINFIIPLIIPFLRKTYLRFYSQRENRYKINYQEQARGLVWYYEFLAIYLTEADSALLSSNFDSANLDSQQLYIYQTEIKFFVADLLKRINDPCFIQEILLSPVGLHDLGDLDFEQRDTLINLLTLILHAIRYIEMHTPKDQICEATNDLTQLLQTIPVFTEFFNRLDIDINFEFNTSMRRTRHYRYLKSLRLLLECAQHKPIIPGALYKSIISNIATDLQALWSVGATIFGDELARIAHLLLENEIIQENTHLPKFKFSSDEIAFLFKIAVNGYSQFACEYELQQLRELVGVNDLEYQLRKY